MKQKLVLIGNGMAGMRVIEELLTLAPDKYDITVFGSEPHGNYNRIMLSPVLAGEKTINDIFINDLQWYQDNNITLFTGSTITHIDRGNHEVVAEDGTRAHYDRLVLATGSMPVMLTLPGHELSGIISFRDIDDVLLMKEAAKTHKKAVVIGGGLLGLEAANGLMLQGMEVTVVHRSAILMNQQIDQTASHLMQAQLEAKGMRFLMNHDTAEFLGNDRVEKIRFTNNTEIDADLVVMAIGIRANIHLAQSAGILCDRGILVDNTLQTYSPNIYAVGECVQYRDQTFGLVAPLFEQAKVCANHLAEMGIASYSHVASFTQLKVTGIAVFSAGEFREDDECDELLFEDTARAIYKKLVLKENKIVGVVLYGDTTDGNWYYSLLVDQIDISAMRQEILFGQHYIAAA